MNHYTDNASQDWQRKCDEFVSREVYVRQNHAMKMNQYPYNNTFDEDCDNMYQSICPDCEEELEADECGGDGHPDGYNYACHHCSSSFDHFDCKPKEVYEWWAVSDYLADKLEERGEVMYDGEDCKIWGRCTTGQAISIDSVIEDIVKEMSA